MAKASEKKSKKKDAAKGEAEESSLELSTPEAKKKALETAIAKIRRDYGEGTIMRLGENTHMNVQGVSTGSLTLDLALGIGGVPRGRIVEIYGPESSGKTTVALHVAAEVQKAGGIAAFIDVEHALDPVYAKALGVDINDLLVSQPDSGEQALEITEALVRSGAVDAVIIDSVAALVTQQEIDGEMGQAQVGAQARLMSQAMRKLAGEVAKSNCVAVFINQLREKVGIVYGNPEVTPGGRALKFYASVRIEVRKSEQIKNGAEIVGNRVKCKVVKNKVARPFGTAEFDLLYGKGISKVGEVLDLGTQLEILEKSGAWYKYNGERIGQGREKAKEFLEQHPDWMAEIEQKVKENIGKLDNIEEGLADADNEVDDDEPFDITLVAGIDEDDA